MDRNRPDLSVSPCCDAGMLLMTVSCCAWHGKNKLRTRNQPMQSHLICKCAGFRISAESKRCSLFQGSDPTCAPLPLRRCPGSPAGTRWPTW
jgi:hypothetical protein